MHLRINGKAEVLPESVLTLAELVVKKGLVRERVVIERNLRVIPREDWSSVRLEDQDDIEIVSFVGGG